MSHLKGLRIGSANGEIVETKKRRVVSDLGSRVRLSQNMWLEAGAPTRRGCTGWLGNGVVMFVLFVFQNAGGRE